jgi:uncharacterized integral membrane protein
LPPSEPKPSPAPDGGGLSARAVAFLVGAILLLVFMLENTRDARVHLFFWHVNLPLWFVIFGSALAGAILWAGFGVVRLHRRRQAGKEASRKKS